MRFSPLMLLPPVLFAGLAALFILGMGREAPDNLPSALVGRQAPELALPPLGDLPGIAPDALAAPGVKLVNFWASWCTPCRVEHPQLLTLAREGVVIYGVNYKDRPEDGLAFLTELASPYAGVGVDPNGRMALDYGVYGVPETFVLDGAGRVVLRWPGPITERVLADHIRPAIAKAGE